MLGYIGVSEEAVAVYHSLLQVSETCRSDLVEGLAMSRPEADSAVEELQDLGLVRVSRESGHISASDPEHKLDALAVAQEMMLAERAREIREARASLTRLVDDYRSSRAARSSSAVEQFTGPEAIRERFEELTQSASEVRMFEPSEEQDGPALMDEAALRGSAYLRAVYLRSARNRIGVRGRAKRLLRRGGEVRTAPLLPVRMAVVDDVVAMPVEDDSEHRLFVLRTGPVLAAMGSLFEMVWESAQPFDLVALPAPRAEFDDTDRAVLKLLADGLTDEAVARKLGVSLRTVRRITARLMEHLNVRSRFAAGVRVAELNLV